LGRSSALRKELGPNPPTLNSSFTKNTTFDGSVSFVRESIGDEKKNEVFANPKIFGISEFVEE
jgi:hypothetical protein